MSYKTFGGRSCKSCSGRPSNLPYAVCLRHRVYPTGFVSHDRSIGSLTFSASLASLGLRFFRRSPIKPVLGQKKAGLGSLYSKKKTVLLYSFLFCFWLYQFHPETRNFALWQSFSLKTVPQKSHLISPHGPMARGSWGRFYPQIYWWNVCSAHGKGRKWKECRYFLKYEVSHHDNHTLVVFFLGNWFTCRFRQTLLNNILYTHHKEYCKHHIFQACVKHLDNQQDCCRTSHLGPSNKLISMPIPRLDV